MDFTLDFFEKKIEEFYDIKESKNEEIHMKFKKEIMIDLEITQQEAIEGSKQNICFNRYEKCKVCMGTKLKKDKKPQNCSQCFKGKIRKNNLFEVHCFQCDGTGQIFKDSCG